MKSKDFLNNIDQLAQEYELTREQTIEAFKKGLIAGCKKNFQVKNCCVVFQKEYEEFFLYKQYLVVEKNPESIYDNNKKMNYIALEEARNFKNDCQIDDLLEIEVNPKDFNFYASKEFKNKFNEELVKQKRENIYFFYKNYENKLINAKIIEIHDNFFLLKMEKDISVFLLKKEVLPNDDFCIGENILLYVTEVQNTTKMPKILVSRIHPNFIVELFKEFIPEISEGIIQIMGVARIPSIRTKIGLKSTDEQIDPIGACIGEKRNRIQKIINVLKGEKVDLFLWSTNTEELIKNALKPSQIEKIISLDETQKKVSVLVTEDQVSLAIGKLGRNVKLASQAIQWHIDIQTIKEL